MFQYPKLQKEGREEPQAIRRQRAKSRRHSISYQPAQQVKRKAQAEIKAQSRAQDSVNNLVSAASTSPDWGNSAVTTLAPEVANLSFVGRQSIPAQPKVQTVNRGLSELLRTTDFRAEQNRKLAAEVFRQAMQDSDSYTQQERDVIQYLTGRKTHEKLEVIHAVADWIHHPFKEKLARFAQTMPAKEALALAEKSLLDSRNYVVINGFNCCWDDEKLCDFARQTADRITRIICKQQTLEQALFLAEIITDEFQRPLLDTKKLGIEPTLARYSCEYWWRRQFRKLQSQRIEQLSRDLTLTGGNRAPYCTNLMLNYKQIREERNDNLLKSLFAIAEGDENPENWVTLYDCAMKSVSNPVVKAAELMVRMRGFEEAAHEMGYSGEFITITAPSRFHSVLKNGKPNPHYVKGLTARDAHKWISDIFVKVRAAYGKAGLKPFGFRVVEPHHDGCPHWHLFLFIEPENRNEFRDIFNRYYLAENPPKNPKVRIKFKTENKKLGSATGYIAKYITKGINGQHVDTVKDAAKGKELKLTPDEAARRIKVNLTSNSIRQFQQIGGPTVTVWREMRRLGQAIDGQRNMAYQINDKQISDLEHFQLEAIRRAADAGDWKAFCVAMGGVQVKRNDQLARIHYSAPEALNRLSGEYEEIMFTRYGDQPKGRVQGVDFQQLFVATRMSKYSIKHKNELIQANNNMMLGMSQAFDVWEQAEAYEAMAEQTFQEIQKHLDLSESYEQEILIFENSVMNETGSGLPAPSHSSLSDLCH